MKKIGSFLLAFITVNSIFFIFRLDAMWLTRSGGATSGVYMPNHYISNLNEGMGFRKVDENGYLNSSADIGNDYVLVFGKSHTNAIEVPSELRYVELLSQKLQEQDKVAYSVARGGNTFADLITGFKALIEEFPDSSAIVLEIDETDSLYEIDNFSQRQYVKEDSIEYLEDNITASAIVKGGIKELTPLLAYLIDVKLSNVDWGIKSAFLYQKEPVIREVKAADNELAEDLSQREDYLTISSCLQMIRKEYKNKIIILYHPEISFREDGSLQVNDIEQKKILQKACSGNNILFCDAGPAFEKAYREDYSVPYGFFNTTVGDGHLNRSGHKIIADLLYDNYLRE